MSGKSAKNGDTKRTLTRRHLLRGAGVALALPWLESFAPRRARGQAAAGPRRFVPVYFPLGTASYWAPTGTGAGDAWQLSPILEPLLPLKDHVTVLSHVDNTAYGAATVSPMYPRETGSFLTCAPATGTPATNGISIDQVIAQSMSGSAPPIASLQLGLSTLNSYTEDLPPAFSRSISWSATGPLGKQIDPQAVFDHLVSATPNLNPASTNAALQAKWAAQKSVLDFVRDDASAIQPRLSHSDRVRVDQFLTSVRDLEQRVQGLAALPPVPACAPIPRPTASIVVDLPYPAGYTRQSHATLMIDLIVMAFACDTTRVVSLMLDDARSDFVYDFLTERNFTAAGSTPGTGAVAGYFGLAEGTARLNDGYATINRWFVSTLADLAQKLAALPEGDGSTVLDNSVLWFGSGMNDGIDRSFFDLPLLYVGGGGGVLRQGLHLDFAPDRRLSDVYLTLMQKVFGLTAPSFADSQGIVPEILA